MEKMQFREYVFPTNPRIIRCSAGQQVVSHFCPNRGDVVQHLGRRAQVIRCEGCFWGETLEAAAAQLSRFEAAARNQESGALYIPGRKPVIAYLESLEWEASGDGRVIYYVMTFLERL